MNQKLWYGCPVDAPASEAMRIVDSFDTWRRQSKMEGIKNKKYPLPSFLLIFSLGHQNLNLRNVLPVARGA